MTTFWVCVQTKSGRELQVETDLGQSGYDVYLPRKRTDLRTRRNRKIVIEALYPTYLFVKVEVDITDIRPIKQTDDVMRVVQFGGQLAKVSDTLITALKALEDAQGVHVHKHEYAEGDAVRVKSGPLRQYEAVIESLDKNDRAVIKLITGAEIGNVPLMDLEPAA